MAKRVEMRLDNARNVWTHGPSGKSVCNWGGDVSRETMHGQAVKMFGELYQTEVEIVFVDDPLSPRETIPQVVKVTNFQRDAAPVA